MPKLDEQDLLIVKNIDTGCTERDEKDKYSHKDYFQVTWDKVPIRISPGETRILPRYQAMHFAKHLTDHLIELKSRETKSRILNNSKIREDLMKRIIVGVERYYNEFQDEEEEPKDEFDYATSEAEIVEDEVLKEVEKEKGEEAEEETDSLPSSKRTKIELMKEADELGIEYNTSDTKADILEKIREF